MIINNAIEMTEENLNIEWWHKRMILYALKKFDTQSTKEAGNDE